MISPRSESKAWFQSLFLALALIPGPVQAQKILSLEDEEEEVVTPVPEAGTTEEEPEATPVPKKAKEKAQNTGWEPEPVETPEAEEDAWAPDAGTDLVVEEGAGLGLEEVALVFDQGGSKPVDLRLDWLQRAGLPLGAGTLEGLAGVLSGPASAVLGLREGLPTMIKPARGMDLKEGSLYFVVRKSAPVKRPSDGRILGQTLRVIGTVRVEKGGTEPVGILKKTWEVIRDGDLLQDTAVWDKALAEIRSGSPVLKEGRLRVQVIAVLNNRSLGGAGDAVLIDRGEAAGLKPGLRFRLERAPSSSNTGGVDDGELEVLMSRGALSLARITRALRAVKPGDRAFLSAAP